MPNYATYLRRMDGILLQQETADMLRDQINNAVEILDGVKESLLAEHVPRQYVNLIIEEIKQEVQNG